MHLLRFLSVTRGTFGSQPPATGVVKADQVHHFLWKFRGLHLAFAQVLYYLLRRAVQNVLAAEHYSAHTAVLGTHEALLHEEGALVPAEEARAHLESFEHLQGASEARGARGHDHAGAQRAQRPKNSAAREVREAREVRLAQVSTVVHMQQEV